MTAIIAVLDNKWVHIWTDSREWADWRKSDNKVKCITISKKHTHTWCWSWWLQAMSVYLFVKWIEFWDDEETFIKYWINQAIKMDINCWWEAKYYFLKKPEAKEEKKSKRTMASDLAKLRKTDGQ